MDCGGKLWDRFKKTIHINCKKLKTTLKQNLVVFQDKKPVMHQKIFSTGGKFRLG